MLVYLLSWYVHPTFNILGAATVLGLGCKLNMTQSLPSEGSQSSVKNGQIDKLLSYYVRGSLCRVMYKVR